MATTNIPPSIPSKRLASPLTAAGTTLIINNIADHLGNDLTTNDVPALMYVTLYNDAKTKFEVIEVDGTTIATAATTGATINKRGLSFDGGTTAAAETAQDWTAGDTVVQLGSNPSQYFMSLAGTQTITGTKTFTGATTLSSTLAVTGAVTMSSTLAVTGAATFSSNATVTGTLAASSAMTVAEGLDVSSALAVTGATTLSSALSVTGATTLSSTLGVTGKGTFSSAVDVTATLACSSGVTITDAGTGKSLYIQKTATTGSTSCAVITNDSTGYGMFLTQNGDAIALRIVSTAVRSQFNADLTIADNGAQTQSQASCLRIQMDNADSIASPVYIADNNKSDSALVINKSNSTGSGHGLYIVNSGKGRSIDINQTITTGATDYAAVITNDSTGEGLYIDQNGDAVSLLIDSEATTQPALKITGYAPAQIIQDISNGYGLQVQRNIAEAGANNMVNFINDNTADTAGAVKIQNDGSGAGLYIQQTNTTSLALFTSGMVAIGSSSMSSGALLSIISTSKGVVLPNCPTSGIVTPTEGTIIYNQLTKKLNIYCSSGWEQITSAST